MQATAHKVVRVNLPDDELASYLDHLAKDNCTVISVLPVSEIKDRPSWQTTYMIIYRHEPTMMSIKFMP